MNAHIPGAPIDIDIWRRGSARLVECSGRARVHDLRNALNAVAIGVELLASGDGPGRGRPGRERRVAAVRREIGVAGSEVGGLSALFAETLAPSFSLLPDVIRWAFEAAEPVARRRGVRLDGSCLTAELPEVNLPVGANVALALLLVESCLTARRGSRCAARLTSDPVRLTLEWQYEAGTGAAELELARAVFREVMGEATEITVRRSGDFRQLTAALEPAR